MPPPSPPPPLPPLPLCPPTDTRCASSTWCCAPWTRWRMTWPSPWRPRCPCSTTSTPSCTRPTGASPRARRKTGRCWRTSPRSVPVRLFWSVDWPFWQTRTCRIYIDIKGILSLCFPFFLVVQVQQLHLLKEKQYLCRIGDYSISLSDRGLFIETRAKYYLNSK